MAKKKMYKREHIRSRKRQQTEKQKPTKREKFLAEMEEIAERVALAPIQRT